MTQLHTPVMLQECLKLFEGIPLNIFFEGTLGAGGHAQALLAAHPEIERYLACDLDPEALKLAKAKLNRWSEKIETVWGNFAHLDQFLKEKGITKVNGFFLT